MSERRLAMFAVAQANGRTVAINPEMVQRIYGPPTVDPGTVRIFFGDDSAVSVQGDIGQVAKLLGFDIAGDGKV
jgi:hypothetical protein